MQISALLGITNPQVEVPSNGAPAGFEMLIAQLLATAGGPEPPGAPPGEAIPCGEKLTTLEPNAPSIQPDSAADAQNANFAFAMALAQTDLAGLPTPSPVPFVAVPTEPIVEIAPDVLLSKSSASLEERAALVKLLDNPDLGITRIAVDRDVATGIDVTVPRNAGEEISKSVDAIVSRNAERETTKGADAVVSPNAGEETTRRAGAVVPRHSEARNSDPIVSRNAQGESAKGVDAIVPRNAEEQTSKGPDPVVPRNAEDESMRRAGAVVPRNVEGELPGAGDSILSSDGEGTETAQRGFGEPSRERSDSENPHQPKPTLIEATAPIAKATSTKIESIDRPAPSHELVRALADRIETALATRPQERITIEFRPLDLGDIKVILTQQNDQVEAQIITDNERVRQAVHAVQAELRQSLEQRGVQLGAFSVSDFGSHQEPSRQNPSQPQPQFMPAVREFATNAAPVRPTYAPARATGVDLSI